MGLLHAAVLHGAGLAWPLGTALTAKLLVDLALWLDVRRGLACALVWAHAAAALALNSWLEGGSFEYLAVLLLRSRWLGLAGTLDRLGGLSPAHFTVGGGGRGGRCAQQQQHDCERAACPVQCCARHPNSSPIPELPPVCRPVLICVDRQC